MTSVRTDNINERLSVEILQRIFRLAGESLTDALRMSTVCHLWRRLIFNEIMLKCYWKFDEKYRRKGLIRWWNFVEKQDNDPFFSFPTADCFLGKCISLPKIDTTSNDNISEEFPDRIDRGGNYSVAFWLFVKEIDQEPHGIFMVSDDDWDYARSAGVVLDESSFLSIAFVSSISQRLTKSNVQMEPNKWFHIVLVQEHLENEETPQQRLWINGNLELITNIPIAAYSNSATISFYLWNEWHRSIADLSIWSRCLSSKEIRAIYEQKISIDKANVSKYIFENFHK